MKNSNKALRGYTKLYLMKHKILLFVISVCIFSSCEEKQEHKNESSMQDQSTEQNLVNDTMHIKIYVDAAGKITADAKEINLTNLDTVLRQLAKKGGGVWYSRDNAAKEPPKESMQVMDLIVKYSLPVKFYTDKDFQNVYIPH
jgi:biopolymer transport protein ExbD